MQTLGVIQRTLHATPKSCRATAYQTLVKPKLEYASTAWGSQTPGNMHLLEYVQNRAARFVCRDYSRTTSVTGLKSSLKWDSLEFHRNTKDCVMRYKVHNHEVHMKFPTVLTQKPRLGRHDHWPQQSIKKLFPASLIFSKQNRPPFYSWHNHDFHTNTFIHFIHVVQQMHKMSGKYMKKIHKMSLKNSFLFPCIIFKVNCQLWGS